MANEIGCSTSALDYFSPTPRHTDLIASKRVTYYPKNTITNADTILFDIPPIEEYIDTNLCNVVFSLKVTNTDGTDLTANAKVALTDNVAAALFKSVTLYINSQRITESNVYQPFENYFTSRFGYSKNASKIHLKHLLGLTTEAPGKNDALDESAVGWTERQAWTALSAEIQFVAPIPCDFFKTCREYLPPLQEVRLEFKLNDPKFVLTGDGNFKYTLTSIKLDILQIEVAAGKTMAIFKQQALTPLQLHYTNMQIQSYTIPAKTNVSNLRGLFKDTSPSQICMILVETARITGSIMKKDKFKFEHGYVEKVILRKHGLIVNNVEHVTNFDKKDAKELYDRVLDTFQAGFSGTDINLSYEQFLDGSTMWVWNLTPNHDSSCAVGMPLSKGEFDADIYVKPGQQNEDLTALFLAKFDGTVLIGPGNDTTSF
jgi:hypothetical protein